MFGNPLTILEINLLLHYYQEIYGDADLINLFNYTNESRY